MTADTPAPALTLADIEDIQLLRDKLAAEMEQNRKLRSLLQVKDASSGLPPEFPDTFKLWQLGFLGRCRQDVLPFEATSS